MKKFAKNVFAGAMVAVMALSLAACGSSEKPAEETSNVENQAEGTADETASDDRKVLIMGTNAEFPPYEFHEGGEIVGIDAEVAAAIAEKMDYDFLIEDMAFDSIIPAVASGKVSMGMAGMTVTDERKESVDFSDSYATGVQVVIVTEGSAITSVDDLFAEGADHVIGVQTGTTGDLYSTWDIEEEGLGSIERFSKGADAVQALATGKVDCVIIDNEPAKEFVASIEGLTILDTAYAEEEYAICLAKDSPLTEEVNNALNELIADGTVQTIIDKYISAE